MANLLCLQLLQAFMYDVERLLHWANTVVIVVAPLVSLHCCVAHTWVCWFQFLCKEPERDRTVVRSHLSHIFPLHSELAHAHNYPCSRYQALFFARPSVRSLCTRKIRPGDEAKKVLADTRMKFYQKANAFFPHCQNVCHRFLYGNLLGGLFTLPHELNS